MRIRPSLVVVILIVVIGLVLPAVQVCRDWQFIDHNTGSRKGYREWFWGWRTGRWYRESALEEFMRSNHPAEFRQEWVSYAGTGRDGLGRRISSGHGRPGPIVLLQPDLIDGYCETASPAGKRRLYGVFSRGDEKQIEEAVDAVWRAMVLESPSDPNDDAGR